MPIYEDPPGKKSERIKQIQIEEAVMEALFNMPGDALIKSAGFPKDARLVDVKFDIYSSVVSFIYYHPKFDPIVEGMEPPPIILYFTRMDVCDKCKKKIQEND